MIQLAASKNFMVMYFKIAQDNLSSGALYSVSLSFEEVCCVKLKARKSDGKVEQD